MIAFPLKSLIALVLDRLATTCRERNLTVLVEDLERLPAILIDVQQLQVAFANVIDNAVKYTPDGGQIKITGRCIQEGVEIAIRDTGFGIPVEQQGHIFDLFHALNPLMDQPTHEVASQERAFGLGLPIAKGIVEAHQGSIWLESSGYDLEKLPGTTCYIALSGSEI